MNSVKDKDNLLQLGNVQKLIKCLSSILSDSEIGKIKEEIKRNVNQLISLSRCHLRCAQGFNTNRNWRQIVSRSYYTCYIASRAVRFAKEGQYDTSPDDHKQIGKLPNDFPDRDEWKDKLTKLRADRKTADYDHTAGISSLELEPKLHLINAIAFQACVKKYLKENGLL
jgi:uncharacterized protein (UPF0332 family)